jgi:sulfonate transport system permease protein
MRQPVQVEAPDESPRPRPRPGWARRIWSRHRAAILALLIAVVLWEVLGRLQVLGNNALPPPTRVLLQLWRDRSVYPGNLATTLREALVGYIIGNVIAIALALMFVEAPRTELAFTGLVIALFSMPIIAAAPVLATAFSISTAKVALAGIAVFFPTLINAVVGLRSVERSLVDTIRAMGGNRWTVFFKVRIRAALPSILVGLRIAAPAALLGAILGEFLGGDQGLGVFMMNSMAQFETARTWGAGLVSTAIAGLTFGMFALLGRRATVRAHLPTIGLGAEARIPRAATPIQRGLYMLRNVGVTAAVTLAAWYLFIFLFHLDTVVAKTPLDVVRFFVSGPEAADHRHLILTALLQTLPLAGIGLLCGLAAACIGAVGFVLRPSVEKVVMPFAMILQSVPLAAMTPLIVILLGRGSLASVVVSVFVTFFPSLVTLTQGLRSTPPGALELLTIYDASRWTIMRKAQVPHAVPYVFAAARLAAPRALLGVMIAEWLATGRGLGYLLVNARFLLQFDVVWAAAVVATLFALLAYISMAAVEARAMKRFAPQQYGG